MGNEETKKILFPAQEVQLRRWLEQNWKQDVISASILLLAWDAGLFPGEIGGLQWDSVDLSGGLLTMGTRQIPMKPMLEDLLSELVGESIYVIPNGRSPYTPMNRVSVSRRARQALDRAGLQGVALTDLRDDYILRLIKSLPMEDVVRNTGYEVRSIQEFARRYGVKPPRLSEDKHTASSIPADALLAALEKEGDTLDSRVVILSWLGGLTLEQMSRLQWTDLSVPGGVWVLNGQETPIPKALLPFLSRWQEEGEYPPRVLHGPRSTRPLSIHELSCRGKEFFIRHHLSGYSLALLRGKAEPALLRRSVLALVQTEGRITTGKAAASLGISLGKARRVLQDLAEEGRVSRGSSGVYQMPGSMSAYQHLLAFLRDRKGETASRREISGLLSLPDGSVTYYIKRAEAEGLLERERRGIYRVL